MSDHIPGQHPQGQNPQDANPLDDRLRASFQAEHADIERRSATASPTPLRSRSMTTWMPLGLAAAVLAIAGFLFISNRGDDSSVQLDTASQTDTATAVPAIAEPAVAPTADADASTTPPTAAPAPTPTTTTVPLPMPVTLPGWNDCAADAAVPADMTLFVWDVADDDPDGGLIAHITPGIDTPVTRVLPPNGIATSTGRCLISDFGTPWYELITPASDRARDWASGLYLRPATNACFVGEGFSEPSVDQPGGQQLLGPRDGTAVIDDGAGAFAATGADRYYRYPGSNVVAGACFGLGPSGPACLSGDVVIDDPQSPEPIFTSTDSMDVSLTGRTLQTQIEVRAVLGDIELVGLVDPDRTNITTGSCTTPIGGSFSDDFASRPCAIDENTPLESSETAGHPTSTADHIHNIRVEEAEFCVRVVIELGSGLWSDNDVAANLVPPIEVVKDLDSTEIFFDNCAGGPTCLPWTYGEGEPARVDFRGGSAFVAINTDNRRTSVTMLNDSGFSNVTLMESPARIVIDWQPGPTTVGTAPVTLERVILERSLIRLGDRADQSPGIRGFARPFEANGAVIVLEAPDNEVVPSATPTLVWSGRMATAGWVEGWGEFAVNLPELDPGNYFVIFGEAPPSGESAFVGSGGRIIVADLGDGSGTPETYLGPTIDRIEFDAILQPGE